MWKYLFLLLAILYSLSFNLWVSCADSFYWYSRCELYDGDFVYVLFLWLGNMWRRLTNDNIQLFWLGGWLLSMLSILIPYFFCLGRKEWVKNLPFLALGIALYGRYHYQLFSPDRLTLFFTICVFVTFWKTRLESKQSAFYIGVLSSLLTASRFPNILILVVVLAYYVVVGLLNRRYKKYISNATIYLLTFFACFYAIVVLITGKWNIGTFAYDEIGDGVYYNGATHTLWSLIERYKMSAYTGLSGFAALFGCASLLHFVNENLGHFKQTLSLIIAVVAIVVGFHYYKDTSWFVVYSSIIVFLMFYKALNEGEWFGYLNFLFVLLLGLLVCAGSDSGFTKTFWFFASIAPLIFISYKPEISRYITFRYSTVIILCISIHSLAYEARLYRNWAHLGKVQVLMRDEEYHNRELVFEDYEHFAPKGSSIFYGYPDAHFMYAATGELLKYKPTYWMGLSGKTTKEHDEREIREILSLLQSDHSLVLLDYSHSEVLEMLAAEFGLSKNVISTATTIYSYN